MLDCEEHGRLVLQAEILEGRFLNLESKILLSVISFNETLWYCE